MASSMPSGAVSEPRRRAATSVLAFHKSCCVCRYGPDTAPVEAWNFTEDVHGKDIDKFVVGHVTYALGGCITRAFARHAWPAAIKGLEGGGLVNDLPIYTFQTEAGDTALTCPTELGLTETFDKTLSELGFYCLSHYKGTDYAVFFETPSCQKPVKYNTDAANKNASLSAQLQYILCTSRFAHHIKAMMRDRVASFVSRKELETHLNEWILQYALDHDDAPQESKAGKPLREARIDVTEVPGKPGVYRAVAFLRPHFQLIGLTIDMRLVAELPPPLQQN